MDTPKEIKSATTIWYENWTKQVQEDAKKLKQPHKDVDQHILHLKSVVLERIEKENNPEVFGKTFRTPGGTFGFTEKLVNQLMQYAYESGRKDIDKKSYDRGVDETWNVVANKLGLYTEQNEN